MEQDEQFIQILGARQHNLKGIDLAIPKHKLSVIIGPSGSGKSTLAFDVIYAEAQRRFIECQSLEGRAFFEQLPQPEVLQIKNLAPAIGIRAQGGSQSSRQSVSSLSRISDILRLLFSQFSTTHCPSCNRIIQPLSVDDIVMRLLSLPNDIEVFICAPLAAEPKILEELLRQGFTRITVANSVWRIEDYLAEGEPFDKQISLLVDRLRIKPDNTSRLRESLTTASACGHGLVEVSIFDNEQARTETFSAAMYCTHCSIEVESPDSQLFSYNTACGTCSNCNGLGKIAESNAPCEVCLGSRFSKQAALYTIGASTIHDWYLSTIASCQALLKHFHSDATIPNAAHGLTSELQSRLSHLSLVGLSHLQLTRGADTLSYSEQQRVLLASQLGNNLSGVLYVLDEPTAGLHPLEAEALANMLLELRNRGNTVLAIAHEAACIDAADFLIELGPGSGPQGGELLAFGDASTVRKTAAALKRRAANETHLASPRSFTSDNDFIELSEARQNNLRIDRLRIPLQRLVALCGCSGAGKSSLLFLALLPTLQDCSAVKDVVVLSDRTISATQRSTTATLSGAFAEIRRVFSLIPEAKARGFTPAHFSYNTPGGRCENCQGLGELRLDLRFLANSQLPCPRCNASRYKAELAEIRFRGNSIQDVLRLTVGEAKTLFFGFSKAREPLQALCDVGLEYLQLGQSATQLSSGELQRIRLANALFANRGKRSETSNIYLLQEPTRGLSGRETERLLGILQQLVDTGASVFAIENNPQFLNAADWIIELGPGTGPDGGRCIADGAAEALKTNPASIIGRFL